MLGVFFAGVGIMLAVLMLSVPLPYCFGGALAFMAVFGDVSMKSMMLWAIPQITSQVLLASPLFILSGSLMGSSGIATQLLNFIEIFTGRAKSALGAVSAITCAVIGAISGSGYTGIAAIGPIMIPRMVSMGYSRGYSTALVTAASILGLLIPPSVNMILYGWVTETSILACFLSTLGPGVFICLLMCIINAYVVRNVNISLPTKEEVKQKRKEFIPRTAAAFPALMMPVIILGGIYGGVFTATEAAAVSAVYAVPVGLFIYKGLKGRTLYKSICDSTTSIGAVMGMIFCGLMLGQVYAFMQIPEKLASLILGVTTNKFFLLMLINIFLLFVGMVMSDTMGILLCAPLLLPIVKSIGIDPIHFAAIMGTNLAMGGITPPYASILYFGMKIGDCTFAEVLKPILMMICFAYIPGILLATYWEPLSMYLPRLLGY
ncbi:TRAP transporter large permease [Cloacibacillus sp.]|uniref:TRAP transporter large permease n=1 Tax=Cloacibacillus sp. TaxID=2049023 RepID=UPI0025C172D5|nr:TRAP transporter large permease [Cloacibacillus sp.]MCC8057251.1 TRAP transporter large permease [Cloacibacillus sp.]